ncbi:hypothetical protein [Actinomadura sp. DC4]|uniref:hypothetical protein n=1 Tax=Actinomadura sp. DC4 TaxID=3055069 RepID=UPI0025B02A93|nr:hypothetical protein [Actinomadura sp. DC4]MDN3353809.1 hypothetical protein [Actinomadura sp. DC4]
MLDDWRRRGPVSAPREDLTTARTPLGRSALNCSIFYTDVAGFSAPCRTEADRQLVRTRMYEIVAGAFEDSGVSWTACYHEDRGDGVLVIVPPEVPTRAVADPLLVLLAAELRRHNGQAGEAVRIRLRAALHVGPVTADAEGLNADAIIHTARLLDAPPLRDALAASDADLAFMASGHVFDTVLKNDRGLVDPRMFTPVRFQVKESQISAWMYVSGPRTARHAIEPAAPPGDRPGAHFHEEVHVEGDLVLGSKVIDRRRPPVGSALSTNRTPIPRSAQSHTEFDEAQ